MWNYLWPILIVVGANTVYNICAKATPTGVQPFAALTVTYIVAAISSLILFFITSQNKNIIAAVQKVNWTSVVFGLAIIGLEFGYIYIYRNGWNVSVGSLVANISLAIILIAVGVLLYKEKINIYQILGILLCAAGLVLVNIRK